MEGDQQELIGYRRENDDPDYLTPEYAATRTRSPKRPLIPIAQSLTELTGPAFGDEELGELDHDLTQQHSGEPLGERMILHGRVLDGDGRPVRNTLIELWQANAAGRYRHAVDNHPAPIDPNFFGAGRAVTDDEGRYRFITVKPGAYPWRNHENAWRAQHIHISLFGPAFATRMVTQMYFPGDPLFYQDPIFHAVRDERARERMICRFDLSETVPEWALGYEFDIVLRGHEATPMEH
jgi:protocatechuate 3,4-dioxygenase beta subunit